MSKTGLVLSGGGARGLAHIGVLRVLDELGIQISEISGTSAGAIIGAFYSAGYKPKEIFEIARNRKFFGFSNLLFGKPGVFDMKPFSEVYLEYFPHNQIEQLGIPMHISATDIVQGELLYFNSGDLSTALMASSSVPLVFQPVPYNNTLLMDGGIMNNFPIEPLLESCDKIIGVHVNSISKKMDEIHMKDLLDRSFHLALSSNLKEKTKQCTVFISPPDMSRFGLFDMSKMEEIADAGYRHASAMRDQILASLA